MLILLRFLRFSRTLVGIHISKTKTFPNSSEFTGGFRVVRGCAKRRAEESPHEQGESGKNPGDECDLKFFGRYWFIDIDPRVVDIA